MNDFDLLNYFSVAFEFAFDELVARRGDLFARSCRNMSYYAAARAARITGTGNQVKWHPSSSYVKRPGHDSECFVTHILGELPRDDRRVDKFAAACPKTWPTLSDPLEDDC